VKSKSSVTNGARIDARPDDRALRDVVWRSMSVGGAEYRR
jgi:hypothetical protein